MMKKETKITYDKGQNNNLKGVSYRKDSTIILRVTDDLRGQIERTADARGVTLSEAVRFILSTYFEKEYGNESQREGRGEEVELANQLPDCAVVPGGCRLKSPHCGSDLSASGRTRKDKSK